MGKHGPRPEPREQQILKGSWRAKKRPFEPTEVAGEMVKPGWLGPIASAKWDEVMAVLIGRNTISPAYVDFLAAYCSAWQDYFDAIATIKQRGEFLLSATGGVHQHPAVGKKQKAIADIGRFGREFGLSPTSIRDIQVSAVKTQDQGKQRFFGSA